LPRQASFFFLKRGELPPELRLQPFDLHFKRPDLCLAFGNVRPSPVLRSIVWAPVTVERLHWLSFICDGKHEFLCFYWSKISDRFSVAV